jgi:hypothetical protein
MANLTISQLTEILAAGVDNADLLPLWDDTAQETKKITIAQFRTLVSTVNWSETFSSATQATSQWTPLNAATNVNAAITPKGTGAIVAQIPTGTTVGGNARGTYSVDFQMQRTNANQVALGANSGILSGRYNRNDADRSVIGGGAVNIITSTSGASIIGGGFTNTISDQGLSFIGSGDNQTISGAGRSHFIGGGGTNSISGSGLGAFIGGGTGNSITSSFATIVGGQSITVSGTHAFNGGGQNNTASATYSSVLGGLGGVASLYGQQAYGAGGYTVAGDAQSHELIWRRLVTGTSITELFLDGASIAAILPATNTIWQGTIEIASICTVVGNGTTTLGDAQGTSYKVTIKRLGATTTLVGTVQEIGTMNADPSALGIFTIDANDTNESLRIQFTPPPSAGSTTVHRVVATFRGLQIQY